MLGKGRGRAGRCRFRIGLVATSRFRCREKQETVDHVEHCARSCCFGCGREGRVATCFRGCYMRRKAEDGGSETFFVRVFV